MKTLTMKSLDDLDVIDRVIRKEWETHGDRTVVIKKLTESLSEAQFGLYWWWIGFVAAEHGYTKDEQHQIFKEYYMLNIFMRDPDGHPDFIELVNNMNIIKVNSPEQYPAIRSFVIRETHLRDASIDNMREYLTEIENHARDFQIRLPAPTRKDLM